MRRMPRAAPRLRNTKLRTKGRYPFSGDGKINEFKNDRLRPETGQRMPAGGKRKNSTTAPCCGIPCEGSENVVLSVNVVFLFTTRP